MKTKIFLLLLLFLPSAVFAQQSIGRAADSFNGYSLEGKPINSEDFRGKVVVMTFWSAKCAICYSEVPKLNKLAESYNGQNVVFLAPTMNQENMLGSFLKKRPFSFTVIPNSLGILLQYANRDSQGRPNMGYPAYFVIDQSGRVAYKGEGGGKVGSVDNQVKTLLSRN